jgi:tRNA(Ile)-lysidine synthase
MDPVLKALEEAAKKGLLPPGSPVLLAVSGGADSMALLYGSLEAARQTGWTLAVGHVHHGLRGREADRDLAFVSEHARRRGVPFLCRYADARGEARKLGISPEAAARRVRYGALSEMAREAGAGRIAVAHQKDDVAESYLLAGRRRYGVAARSGPRERRADGVVRPLLSVTREEILRFLGARGIGHRRDSTNGNLRLTRNRIRREISAIEATKARAVEALAAAAAACSAVRDRLDREFEEEVRPRLASGPGVTIADAAWLAGCQRELARRALSEVSAPFAAPGRPPLTGREREQILDRLAGGGDFRFEAGRRIRFERRGGLLRVGPRPDAVSAGLSRV